MLQTEFHLRSVHYDTELWDSHLHDIEMESRSKKETNTYNKSSNTQLIIVVDSQLKIEGICHTVHILINITENHPLHTMSICVETHVYLSILVTTLDATMDCYEPSHHEFLFLATESSSVLQVPFQYYHEEILLVLDMVQKCRE